MKVLTLSDVVIDLVYSPRIRSRFGDTDLVIGCGDLPYYYLEYVVSTLDAPVFYVRGNHAHVVEYSEAGQRTEPHGGIDLHRRAFRCGGLLMAGVEGSLRYRPGLYQYTDSEMWAHVISLVPALLQNRLIHGRYLDVFVTHAPPVGIHDQADLPHRGVKAFRWLDRVFRPRYHLHGHIHVYRSDTITETMFGPTKVVNTYGYREIEIEIPGSNRRGLFKPVKDQRP